jgi:CSLREA domain-containing protein
MKSKPTSLGFAALLLASTLAAPFPNRLAPASTVIAVTTIADELNNDGSCSLREAIQSANLDQSSGSMPGECPAGSGQDVIKIPTGTYTLTLSSGLVITSSMAIDGSDAQETIVDGANLTRLMEISGTVAVTLTAMSLRNGHAGTGGGLYVHANSALAVDDTDIEQNYADTVAGILNEGLVSLTDSQVSNNEAWLGVGGIENAGTMTLTRSLIEGNRAGRSTSSVGGIGNTGTLVVISSTIGQNIADIWGGGVENQGTLIMTNSTLQANSASTGAGLWNSGKAVVSASTLASNTVWGPYLGGGAVYNTGNLTLVNDTISGNTATGWPSVKAGQGAGIYNDGGILFLNNVTVADNSANPDKLPGQGAGIYVASGVVTLTNSLFGQNVAQLSPIVRSDCYGTIAYAEYTAMQTQDGCALITSGPGNVIIRSPLLGALADNGGGTLTQALSPGSPAINAASPATPGSSEFACAVTDQRGVARPANGGCDLGAYEFAGPVYHFLLPIISINS